MFAALYATLNAQRDEVMNGIERFSRKQKAMAEQIREQTRKMRDMQEQANPDPAQDDELASQLGVADPHFRGPAEIDILRLRRAGPDREAAV